MFEAYPKTDNPEYGTIDGAYVALFVNEPIQAAAEAAAAAFIEENGWDVGELDEAYPVTIEMYPPGQPSRDRFEQALIDGIVATFHTWPIGGSEDEEPPQS